ncbi:hypothetical protein FACS1894126_1880 [Alphaproteobacteria bacterium]|nr:hypothetical protein FACS1894126_1880 [Alphaproteobacteria bacterium]
MKRILKREQYETMTIDELWKTIGRTLGASDEQVKDLVQRMKEANKEENENGL